MNPDSEKFDSLRRLLALKRHEQPPPGYFNRFSREVISRIKAGETGGEISMETSWIQRLLGMFEVKPVFAGAFGMAVCALLISGVISSEHTVATSPSFADDNRLVADTATAPIAGAMAVENPYSSATTNPVASLFEQFKPQIQAEPASERYWIPNGN